MKLNYLAIPYLATLAFMFGGIINSGGIAWYETLRLPAWNPPSLAIAVIWGVIYLFAAWSLLIVWNRTPRDARFPWLMAGFAVSTAINLAWSVIFFQFHLLSLSVWAALLLGTLVLALAAAIYPHSPKAALLLAPYILWVYFAAYLNYVVAGLN